MLGSKRKLSKAKMKELANPEIQSPSPPATLQPIRYLQCIGVYLLIYQSLDKISFMANVIPLGASTSKYGCLPFLLIQILVIQIVYCIGCSVATSRRVQVSKKRPGDAGI
jgi:hypothetical protein